MCEHNFKETNKGVTSLTRELDREVNCDEVRPVLVEKLSKHLKIPILPLEEPLESILKTDCITSESI